MKTIIKIKQAIISRLNKCFPDPTPIQVVGDDARAVKKYVENPKNLKKAIMIAEGLRGDFQHAFEVKHLVKKYNTEPNAIVAQLQMLSLFKLCSSRLNEKGRTTFRITLSNSERIEALTERYNELCMEMDQIDKEMTELQKE